MSDTVTIRAFEERDLEPTLATLRLALGETALLRRTPEWFAWKHFTNPFGRSLLVVAEADDQIVGLRAFMRWEMATPDGEVLRCVRAVDTATHPDYLRRGIFRRLTLEALDRATEDGVDLVFNTPNPKSGAGYLKMGWVEVGPIGVMVYPTWRLARRRTGSDVLADPEAVVPDAGPAVGLEVADRPGRGLRTPRTPEYLAWRFDGHPTAPYRRVDAADSTAVVRPNLRNGRTELVVSDVFGPVPGPGYRSGPAPVAGRLPGRMVLVWLPGAAGGTAGRDDPGARCDIPHAGGAAPARPAGRRDRVWTAGIWP